VAVQDDVEPLAPLESFDRWEQQQWRIADLDLDADRPAWRELPPFISGEIRSAIDRFFLGEAAVTETLAPMAAAAPSPYQRFFLSTQLADEARHTLFFVRYLQAVEPDGDLADPETDVAAYTRAGWDAAPDYFSNLLDEELREVTGRLASDRDPAAWYRAVTLYHLLVEGIPAVAGQRNLLDAARRYEGLGTLRRGLQNIARDESRHIRFGVGALWHGVRAGYSAEIADQIVRSVGNAVWILVAPERSFPMLMPTSARERAARTAGSTLARARGALLGRVERIGLGGHRAPVEAAWDAAVEGALGDYHARHGRTHPLGGLAVEVA
jgi:ribonucleoside-diphosphate reductase beta chain